MRKPRLRAATAALSAVLMTAGLTFTVAASASASVTPNVTPTHVTPNVAWEDLFNHECVSGSLPGPTNTTIVLVPCGSTTWEGWNMEYYSGYVVFQWAIAPKYCMDGREGTNKVTLQLCGTDGTHEHWIQIQNTYIEFMFENQYNGECLNGREGEGAVTVQPCARSDAHDVWAPAL